MPDYDPIQHLVDACVYGDQTDTTRLDWLASQRWFRNALDANCVQWVAGDTVRQGIDMEIVTQKREEIRKESEQK